MISKKTINDMRGLASERGGQVLSNFYVNAKTKLLWQCGHGHEFEATPNSVQSGHWCPSCARSRAADSQRLGIDFFRDLARTRGGLCLSTEYRSIGAKLNWRCSEGHEWASRADVVIRGGWCPRCGGFTHEELVRSILETSLIKKFPKTRPSWLLNSRGHQMELDGFCEELMLAFEYQGVQHYRELPFFHEKSSFKRRVEDDLLKKELCEKHGVTLLSIPHTVKALDLPSFLQRECERLGLGTGRLFTWNEKDVYQRKSKEFIRLKQYAQSMGGDLLTRGLLTSSSTLLWKCSLGHEWEAVANTIMRGHWCPQCGAEKARLANTLDIQAFIELAESKGGVCLTPERVKGQEELRFRCAYGHEWITNQYVVRQGHWCPRCSKSGRSSRYTLDDAKTLALQNGGLCLSESCTASNHSLTWKCLSGHIFKGTIRAIRKSWCSRCKKEKEFLIACVEAAAERDGLCLSTRFVSAKTKMQWRCNLGHEWETTWDSIKSGRWCPECGRVNQWAKRRSLGL